MTLNTNSNVSLVHDFARLSYLQGLSAHRRILIVADKPEYARFLLDARARYVCSIWDREPNHQWPASTEGQSAEFKVVNYGDLRFREGLFDLAVVLDITTVPNHVELLNELRRVVGVRGNVVIGCPNPGCETRIGPPPTGKGVDYYELYDLLADAFPSVQMIGQAPFTGYAVSDLGALEDSGGISFDAGLLEGGAEEIEWFLAVCGNDPVDLESYSVVQVPLSELGIGGVSQEELDSAVEEVDRLKRERQNLIDDAHRLEENLAQEKAKADGLLADSKQLQIIEEELREVRLELGTRGVRIESLGKDLENERLEAEAARARAVKIAKQFDDERKANQAKQIEEQMAKRSIDIEIQGKLNDASVKLAETSAQLRQAEARAESAERAHDDMIERIRSESAELERLRDVMESIEERRDELEANEKRLRAEIEEVRDQAENDAEAASASTLEAAKVKEEKKRLEQDIELDRKAFADESAQLEGRLKDVAGSLKVAEEELERREALIRDLLVKLDSHAHTSEAFDGMAVELDETRQRLEAMGEELTHERERTEQTRQKIEELEAEIKHRLGDLEEANTRIGELEREVSEKQEQLSSMADTGTSLQEEMSNREERLVKLEGDLQASNWRVDELEARSDQSDREKNELEGKFTIIEDELSAAVEAISGHVHARREAELALATRELESQKTESELTEFIEKTREIEEELAAAFGAISGHHRARVEAELALATLEAERDGVEKELQEFIEKSRELEDELAALSGAKSGQHRARVEAELALATAASEIVQVKAQLDQSIVNARDMEEELAALRGASRGHELARREAEQELSVAQAEVARLQQDISRLTEGNERYVSQLVETKQSVESMEQIAIESQSRIRALESDLQRVSGEKEQLSGTSEQAHALETELGSERHRSTELEQELAATRRIVQRMEDDQDQTRERFDRTSAELLEIKARVSQLEKDLLAASNEKVRFENETTELSDRLEKMSASLDEAKEMEGLFGAEADELRRSFEAAKSELEGAKNHAEKLEQQLKEVESDVRREVHEEIVKLSDLADELEQVRTERDRAWEEMKSEQSRSEGLAAGLQVLRSELAEEVTRTRQAGADAARLAGEVTDANEKLSQKNAVLEERNKEVDSCQRALAALRDDLEQLASTVIQLREAKRAEQNRSRSLIEEVERLSSSEQQANGNDEISSKTNEEIEDLEDKLDVAREELDAAKSSLGELQKQADDQIDALRVELSQQAEEQSAALRVELSQQAEEQLAALKAELQTIEANSTSRENEYEFQMAEVTAQANERVAELESKIAKQDGIISAAEHGREEASNRLDILVTEKAKLEQKIDEMNEALDEVHDKLEKAGSQAKESSVDANAVQELAQIRLTVAKQAETIREYTLKSRETEPLLESLTTQLEEREHRSTMLEKKNRQLQQQLSEQASDSAAWDMELKLRTSRISQLEEEISALNARVTSEPVAGGPAPPPPPASQSMVVLKRQLDQMNDQMGEKDGELMMVHAKLDESATNMRRMRQALQNMLSSGEIEGSSAVRIHDLINAIDRK